MADRKDLPASKTSSAAAQSTVAWKELLTTIQDFARGSAKAVTTDIPGLAMDVADRLAGDTMAVGEKDRSAWLFEKLTGSKSTGTGAETAGGMISPENIAKAMIVGAARLAKSGVAASKGVDVVKGKADILMGKPAPEVYARTGVYAEDGKLKAVVSDAGASYSSAGFNKVADPNSGSTPRLLYGELSDLLTHPELYAIYPELATMKVYPRLGSGAGYASKSSRDGPFIELTTESTPGGKRNLLLHEIQHAIQDIEGFKPGGSQQQFLSFDPVALAARIDAYKKHPDITVRAAAERLHAASKMKQMDAYDKYFRIPGEQEARFTETLSKRDYPEVGQHVLDLLSKGGSPTQFMDTPGYATIIAPGGIPVPRDIPPAATKDILPLIVQDRARTGK